MRTPKNVRAVSAALVILVGLLSESTGWAVGAKPLASENGGGKEDKGDKYLYVWAGDEQGVQPDFLAVVEFNERSANYGRIIATANAPTAGNEAHHCNISSDGNTILCGGLLSLLKDQDGLFFFDISKSRKPAFISSARPKLSSITDDPIALPGGGFLVTMMGSEIGGAPGRVVEFDQNRRLVKEWPEVPPSDGFNPHGISLRPEVNLMITSDFINPITTVIPALDVQIRGSVRVWDLAARQIVRSVPIPPAVGTMDCKLIPGDPDKGGYTCGMFDEGGGHLYYIDTQAGTYTKAFDVNELLDGGVTQIIAITDDGTRLIVPVSRYSEMAGLTDGIVAMLDITDRTHAKVVSVVDLGIGSRPHNCLLTRDQKRVVVTDYFLDQGSGGKIHFGGDGRVHVLNFEDDKLTLDTRFQLNFTTDFPGIQARPHGVAVK